MDCIALQAPLFMGFSRQEYWSGLPSPSPGDLPNSGIRPGSPTLQADSLPSEPPGKSSTCDSLKETLGQELTSLHDPVVKTCLPVQEVQV